MSRTLTSKSRTEITSSSTGRNSPVPTQSGPRITTFSDFTAAQGSDEQPQQQQRLSFFGIGGRGGSEKKEEKKKLNQGDKAQVLKKSASTGDTSKSGVLAGTEVKGTGPKGKKLGTEGGRRGSQPSSVEEMRERRLAYLDKMAQQQKQPDAPKSETV